MTDDLSDAVAVQVGSVITISKHPKANNLILCHVDVFKDRIKIITNLTKTKSNDLMKVALVFPAEVMGILSEAQFVGPSQEPILHQYPQLTEAEKQEIRKNMGTYLEA